MSLQCPSFRKVELTLVLLNLTESAGFLRRYCFPVNCLGLYLYGLHFLISLGMLIFELHCYMDCRENRILPEENSLALNT